MDKYKEALERARGFYALCKKCGAKDTVDFLEDTFPELKESEDERIRRILVEAVTQVLQDQYCSNRGVSKEKVVAWLEKQGEQKYIDDLTQQEAMDIAVAKCFEQGGQKPVDKIEPKFKNGQWIVFNGLTLYVNEVVQGYYRTTSIGGISNSYDWNIDNAARLWTIQDAKDGDVLHSIGWHNDCIFIFNGLDNWKFDEPNGDRAVATGYCCLFVSTDKMEFGIQGPDCIEANTVKPATKEQRNTLFAKMHEAGYMWDSKSKQLLSLKAEPSGEQKPAWSEDDDDCLSIIIAEFSKCAGKSVSKDAWMRCNDFLNSLKDRVQSQPKQELDEDTQQTTWKPSKEQMDAMQMAVSYFDYSWISKEQKLLESLYKDLKKL